MNLEWHDNSALVSLLGDDDSILSLLDKESQKSAASDTNFLATCATHFKAHAAFQAMPNSSMFTIVHHNMAVSYSVEGWMTKNSAVISVAALQLLQHSSVDFVDKIINDRQQPSRTTAPVQLITGRPMSVATQCRQSMAELVLGSLLSMIFLKVT